MQLAALTAACAISIHLVVSDDPGSWPNTGPRPRFTECDSCIDLDYRLPVGVGRVRAATEPILTIQPEDLQESSIAAFTPMFEPEQILHALYVSPGPRDANKVAALVSDHWNDRHLVFICSQVTSVGWIAPTWRKSVPIAVFTSADDATKLAKELGLTPNVTAYDREADEARRANYIRNVLAYYAGLPNGRQRLLLEEPELFDFLDRYPRYWKLFRVESQALDSDGKNH